MQQQPPRGAEGSLGAGWYGSFGGRFVSETLIHALDELTDAAARIATTDAFQQELWTLLSTYVGRPTPLTEATRAVLMPER